MALTEGKALVKLNGSPLPCSIPLVQKTGTTIYPGALCAVATDGYCRPARTSTTDTVVGYAKKNPASQSGTYTSTVAGDSIVEVAAGVIKMNNSADADEIAITELWDFVYVVDDETVAKTDGGGTRIRAGRAVGLDTGGVFVLVGLMMTAADAVTLTGAETLTNKTLTAPTLSAPVIADFTSAAHDHGDANDGGVIVAGGVAPGTAYQLLRTNAGATASEWGAPMGGPIAALIDHVANDIIPVTITSGAIYTIPALDAGSTITLPAAAASGTYCWIIGDGTTNDQAVTVRDATGPTNLTTALTASKRLCIFCVKVGAAWYANAYVGP